MIQNVNAINALIPTTVSNTVTQLSVIRLTMFAVVLALELLTSVRNASVMLDFPFLEWNNPERERD